MPVGAAGGNTFAHAQWMSTLSALIERYSQIRLRGRAEAIGAGSCRGAPPTARRRPMQTSFEYCDGSTAGWRCVLCEQVVVAVDEPVDHDGRCEPLVPVRAIVLQYT